MAQIVLRDLLVEYRDKYHLDFRFMQSECLRIVDPSEHMREICEKMVATARAENGWHEPEA